MGRHILGSCRPITLGVTHEQQLREMKAVEGHRATELGLWGSCGWPLGLFRGCGVAVSLLTHLLPTSSVSAVVTRGDCWWLPQDWQV